MATQKHQPHAHWSNRLSFILAAVGSAVGLGNIWKFPYIAGENGGGAFVLVYLACIVVIGLPILVAEMAMGQKSEGDAVQAFETLHRKDSLWRIGGWIGIISAFLILSFYSVVGGWVIHYEVKSILNQFASMDDGQIQNTLVELLASPWIQVFWHFFFMCVTCGIVILGIQSGIERWNKILMPAFFVLLSALFVYSLFLPGFGQAARFLFSPNFSKLTTEGVLEAVGHSFFTLSLGMGAMITYGSYLRKNVNLLSTALVIGGLDTLIALLAGLVIFSVVFSHGFEPSSGPTLMFQTLPVLFKRIPGTYFISSAFFMLVAFAALTSSVALLEVIVAYWVGSKKMDRKSATLIAGFFVFLVGILSALSTNVLSDFYVLGESTFFDVFDDLTSHFTLPLGGLLISLFYGWILGPKLVNDNVKFKTFKQPLAWGLLWTTRIVAPAGILVMILRAVL